MPSSRDLVTSGVLAVLGLAGLPGTDPVTDLDRPVDVGAVLLVLLAAGATAFRNRHPLPTLLVVAAACSAYLQLTYPYGPILFTVAVAVWTAARLRPPLASGAASLVACAGLLVPLPQHPGALGGAVGILPAVAWVAIPATAGMARRLVAEAGRRERAEADRRLVANERLRLAHEVHDIVGHALAAIQMQADIALHVGEGPRNQERMALATISLASRDALDELRWTLRTHRDEPDDRDQRPPGLGRIDRLVAGVEAAGTRVDVEVRGGRRELPERVDLAAYRLVQESLTNVVRHGSDPHATVTVTYTPDELRLEIANGHPAPPVSGRRGHGLGTSGMRSRVEALGGTFHAGHRDDETYVVAAALPLAPEEVAT